MKLTNEKLTCVQTLSIIFSFLFFSFPLFSLSPCKSPSGESPFLSQLPLFLSPQVSLFSTRVSLFFSPPSLITTDNRGRLCSNISRLTCASTGAPGHHRRSSAETSGPAFAVWTPCTAAKARRGHSFSPSYLHYLISFPSIFGVNQFHVWLASVVPTILGETHRIFGMFLYVTESSFTILAK